MLLIIGAIYIGTTIYLVNQEELTHNQHLLSRPLLYGIIGFMLFPVWNALLLASLSSDRLVELREFDAIPSIEMGSAILFAFITGIVAITSIIIIRSARTRIMIRQLLSGNHKSKESGYNPHSIVHTTAIILMLVQIVWALWTLLSVDLQIIAPTPIELVGSLLIYAFLSFLGVGLFIRRNLVQSVKRLGLRLPVRYDIQMGIGMAIGLYILQIVLVGIWSALASPEVLEEQTAISNQLFLAYSGSLFAGFILAVTTAIGEELLFRGALQPVFGIGFTSLFFALLHIQYTFTPATIIIFMMSLGFGWLRHKYSTTAAIIAHFMYNFIPFIFFALLGNV